MVEGLSPGERQLVEIARALVADARVLILDEPTTSLGFSERERLHGLIRELRAAGLAIVYISHELGDVLRECDHVAVLRDGTVVSAGRATDFTTQGLVGHMVGREIRHLYPTRRAVPATEPLLSVENASGDRVHDVRFTLNRGEILGLFGLMGAGRTELVRVLFGLDRQLGGQVFLEGARLVGGPAERIRRGVALVPEDRRAEGLCLGAPVADNLALANLRGLSTALFGVLDRTAMAQAVRRIAGDVHLTGAADLRAPAGRLSGGNQQKVVLGKWLLTQPRVLILDEPTRGVDVAARAEIYQILHRLADQGTGLLVISSELEELMGICDRMLVMRTGTISCNFQAADFDRERLLRAALPASVA
jgi:ribose transport system ATP-binding protein